MRPDGFYNGEEKTTEEVDEAMTQQQPLLLTDEQLKTFIVNGFLILKTDFPQAFHERLVAQLNEIYDKEGNPGNNILPRIRDLQRVFEHPVITGALTSVLGPDYLLHTHRHGHYNSIPKPGAWHKDSYWGYDKLRNHHPWWAMIMYFPQDTPQELGPTGVLPGTQYEDEPEFCIRRDGRGSDGERRSGHVRADPLRYLASFDAELARPAALHAEVRIHADAGADRADLG